MKLATWNVNSLKVRLPHLLDWMPVAGPDVVCLQETKLEDANFPRAEIEAAGWQVAFSGQKTYNGVAILSKAPLTNVVKGWDGNDPSRILAADVGGITVIDGYLPHGGERGDEAFLHKLAFFGEFRRYLDATYPRDRQVLFMGDFNVAQEPIDVWAPDEMQDAIGFMQEEREALRKLQGWGFTDLFRRFHTEQQFTWWDYRMNFFKRHMGMRIDYAWGSEKLSARVRSCEVDVEPRRWEKPSDHTPVVVTLE